MAKLNGRKGLQLHCVVVPEESPCPRGSLRTNLQVRVLVLVLEPQVFVLVLVLEP